MLLIHALTFCDQAVVEMLVANSADPNVHHCLATRENKAPPKKHSGAGKCRKAQGKSESKLLLKEEKAARKSLSEKTASGNTSLILACQRGNLAQVRLLLEAGAAVNATNFADSTALIAACRNGGGPGGALPASSLAEGEGKASEGDEHNDSSSSNSDSGSGVESDCGSDDSDTGSSSEWQQRRQRQKQRRRKRRKRYARVVKILLRAGATEGVNAQDRLGYTALMCAAEVFAQPYVY